MQREGNGFIADSSVNRLHCGWVKFSAVCGTLLLLSVGLCAVLMGKTVKPEAASSSDTENIYKLQQTDFHRHCCPTMHQAVRMLRHSTHK